jgi:hypothetical protein
MHGRLFLAHRSGLVAGRTLVWLVLVSGSADAQAGRGSATGAGDTARFYAWWTRLASADVGPGSDTGRVALLSGVGRTALPLTALRAPLYLRTPRPPGARGGHWRVGVLHERGGETLVVWIPTDSAGFPEGNQRCAEHRTWLGVVPGRQWAAIELTPYCSETYGPAEVDFALFWVGGEWWPHVEVTWNGPACIPAALYRYDRAARRYILARQACAS